MTNEKEPLHRLFYFDPGASKAFVQHANAQSAFSSIAAQCEEKSCYFNKKVLVLSSSTSHYKANVDILTYATVARKEFVWGDSIFLAVMRQ